MRRKDVRYRPVLPWVYWAALYEPIDEHGPEHAEPGDGAYDGKQPVVDDPEHRQLQGMVVITGVCAAVCMRGSMHFYKVRFTSDVGDAR